MTCGRGSHHDPIEPPLFLYFSLLPFTCSFSYSCSPAPTSHTHTLSFCFGHSKISWKTTPLFIWIICKPYEDLHVHGKATPMCMNGILYFFCSQGALYFYCKSCFFSPSSMCHTFRDWWKIVWRGEIRLWREYYDAWKEVLSWAPAECNLCFLNFHDRQQVFCF